MSEASLKKGRFLFLSAAPIRETKKDGVAKKHSAQGGL
jgi:hypothetical protein